MMHLYVRIASQSSVKLQENGKLMYVTTEGWHYSVVDDVFYYYILPILLHLGSLLL